MHHFYLLHDDHTYSPCSVDEWANQKMQLLLNDNRHVRFNEIDGFVISTAWIGVNYNQFRNPPLVFETMIFPKNECSEIYRETYSSWDSAVEGHKRAIQYLIEELGLIK